MTADWHWDYVAADYNVEQHAAAMKKTDFYKLQIANNQLQFSKQHAFNTLCQGSTWRSVRWDAAGLCAGA